MIELTTPGYFDRNRIVTKSQLEYIRDTVSPIAGYLLDCLACLSPLMPTPVLQVKPISGGIGSITFDNSAGNSFQPKLSITVSYQGVISAELSFALTKDGCLTWEYLPGHIEVVPNYCPRNYSETPRLRVCSNIPNRNHCVSSDITNLADLYLDLYRLSKLVHSYTELIHRLYKKAFDINVHYSVDKDRIVSVEVEIYKNPQNLLIIDLNLSECFHYYIVCDGKVAHARLQSPKYEKGSWKLKTDLLELVKFFWDCVRDPDHPVSRVPDDQWL